MNETLNPHALKNWVETTDHTVMDRTILELATQINKAIQDAYAFCRERPRWESWWDQINRASMSVVLNLAQGFGKGRGYFQSDLMIARGELFETLAALAIGPKEITDPLKETAKQLVKQLNETILNTEDKPPTYNTKNYNNKNAW